MITSYQIVLVSLIETSCCSSFSEQDIPVGRGQLLSGDRPGIHRGPPTALWGYRSVGLPIPTRTAGMPLTAVLQATQIKLTAFAEGMMPFRREI